MSAPGLGLGQGHLLVERQGGVVVDRPVGSEDPAVAVVGVLVETEVGDEDDLVTESGLQLGEGELDDPRGIPGGRTERVLRPGAGTPKRTRAGTPRATSFLASTRSEPTVCWDWPGREPMGTGAEIPSRTKKGAIRSSTPRVVSATIRRRAGVLRSRRSRVVGNGGVSTGPSVPGASGGSQWFGRSRLVVALRAGPPVRQRLVMGSPSRLSAGSGQTFSGFLTNLPDFCPEARPALGEAAQERWRFSWRGEKGLVSRGGATVPLKPSLRRTKSPIRVGLSLFWAASASASWPPVTW